MSTDRDVVVVGGGLIGCLAARALAASGRSVRLIERGPALGRYASSAAAGMLSPQMESAEGLLVENEREAAHTVMLDLCLAARDRYHRFVVDLEAETGRDVHYRADGTLVVAEDESETSRLESTAHAHRARGLAAEYLGGADARRLEPALAETILGGLLLPDDHQVETVALMEAVAVSLSAYSAITVETGAPVEAVLSASGRVTGVRRRGSTVSAEHVVIAAGAWSEKIEGLPRRLTIRPVKGQMAAVTTTPGAIGRTVGGHGAYCVPRDDGRVVIGATLEEAGYDDRVTPEEIEGLLSIVRSFLPVVADAPVHSQWAGLRPGTADSLPIVGEDPALEGLVYATGHYRNGILLAPLTAECVSALIGGKPAPVDLEPFAPDREKLA